MSIVTSDYSAQFASYCASSSTQPLFLRGDARDVLSQFQAESVDFCMTSPPYWGQRQYENGGIGLEPTYPDYIANLMAVFAEVKRVLKPTGALWLNLGDAYVSKSLQGLPWRIALALMDQQGWVLRNEVIWNKVKGGLDNAKDRVRNIHETLFFFVKDAQKYYFDIDAVRAKPRTSKVVNGAVMTATGVTGIRYKRQIEMSTSLTPAEKTAALQALDAMLAQVANGDVGDFRMVIRNQHRTTHSDSARISGRAREIRDRGFYFLKYHPDGSKPDDVWDILPEDTQSRDLHFASYPEDLCKIPLRASCPPDGLALDPFCGTGTTMRVAQSLLIKSVGIDISEAYLRLGEERCMRLL